VTAAGGLRGGWSKQVSALKHGLFRSGFMLCDRCVSNVSCERFKPGSRCVFEQEAFDKVVSELTLEFDLDSLADKILVERAAMYLIRIMRAEAYDATVGVSEKSVFWGIYIGRLDNTLRGLFNDLAISRGKRMKLEKGEALLVSLDEVIRKFAGIEQKSARTVNLGIKTRRLVGLSARSVLWVMWKNDYPKLRSTLKRRSKVGGKKAETS